MSTMTPRQPPSEWIQKRLTRLTVDQYEAIVNSGLFIKRDRFTLIHGLLVDKVPKSPRHTFVAKNLGRKLKGLISTGWDFRIDDAVRLADSEPEPDLSMARGDIEDDVDRHPGPADLAMGRRDRSAPGFGRIAKWRPCTGRLASRFTGSST